MNRKRSHINGLNINGIWRIDPKQIKDEVFNFFKKKFKETTTCRPRFMSSKFKKLSDHARLYLELSLTSDEIIEDVWDCGNDKCLGPNDGFSFKFIKIKRILLGVMWLKR